MNTTGVLLRYGKKGGAQLCLIATAGLGLLFLALKAVEYHLDIRDGIVPGNSSHVFQNNSANLFVNLYYAATGLHAVHLTIAVIWMAGLSVAVKRAKRPLESHFHVAGLYWHFVDVIWIFLYPVLYLGRTGP